MKHSARNEQIIVFLLIIIALSLNALVWVGKIARIPVEHTYIPTHNSLSDYAFYVSVIRQGIDGNIAVFNRFTTELHEGSAIHFFYLVIGQVSRFIGIQDAHIAYHATRYLLGIIWCVTIYRLISLCVKGKWVRILAVCFALFSASFPRVIDHLGSPSVTWYMTWWSELDPVIRTAFIPHFMMGHIMMVTVYISILEYVRFQKQLGTHATKQSASIISTWWHRESIQGKRWVVRAAIASWIAAFVHPPSAIQILLICPILMMFSPSRSMFVVGSISMVSSLIGLAIINSISNIFPWNLPRAFEGWSFALSVKEYLLALGPVVVLALIGIAIQLWIVRKKRTAHLTALDHIPFVLLVSWVVTSIVMIPLSKLMPFSPIEFIRNHPISNIRFLQVAAWVPLSVLGAFGFTYILKKSPILLQIILIAVMACLTFVGYPATISAQINHMYFSREYQYPDRGYIAAIEELADITKPDQSIMSLSLAGMTIPTYINRSVYVGQIVYTPDLDNKLASSWGFFKGSMSPCDAYHLVKTNRIGAVFYSFDEKNAGAAPLSYSFLQPWNSFGTTQIYSVIDVEPVGCEK